ncbi:hypothetical protein [uncultured Ferrimonas sp.]|uniref:esterase/lipase family protein n=1 Tax=uncultured Ferrimonas sp. TaxID=432640 RepID=UPI0026388BCE|nr:hypothetical protein [uncultured Ferrimonas sp.]
MAKVVLLHGLYMNGLVMWPLAKKLQQAGWQTECISYNSMKIDPDALFAKLDASLDKTQPCYLIGHSLGGVMLTHYVHQTQLHPDSKVVTLGSPLRSSRMAKQLSDWGLGLLLGNAAEHGLTDNAPQRWTSPVALGSLAGHNSFGMGTVVGATDTHSDGTVQISETELEGMRDHLTLDVTHTSMLIADDVASQCDAFLRHGRFHKG